MVFLQELEQSAAVVMVRNKKAFFVRVMIYETPF